MEKEATGKNKYFDYNLLAIIVFLVCFGLVMLYSTSSYSAQLKFGDSMYYFKRQGLISLASLFVMFFVSKIDYHIYARWAKKVYWLSCKVTDFSEADYCRAYEQLSPDRKAHIDRFQKPADRTRSLAGQLLVGKLLSQLGLCATLHRDEKGRPYLQGCDYFVSIAHCEDLVVCALDEKPVGIDVEKIRPIDVAAAARHVCTPEEHRYLQAGDSLTRFYEIWTGKEAWFKKQGTGIQNLRSVNILPLERQLHRIEDYLIQII